VVKGQLKWQALMLRDLWSNVVDTASIAFAVQLWGQKYFDIAVVVIKVANIFVYKTPQLQHSHDLFFH